jgi:hypothetical protein
VRTRGVLLIAHRRGTGLGFSSKFFSIIAGSFVKLSETQKGDFVVSQSNEAPKALKTSMRSSYLKEEGVERWGEAPAPGPVGAVSNTRTALTSSRNMFGLEFILNKWVKRHLRICT